MPSGWQTARMQWRFRCRSWGAAHTRVRVPTATAKPHRPHNSAGCTTATTTEGRIRPRRTARPVKRTPTPRTGSAGAGRAMTRVAATPVPSTPRPSRTGAGLAATGCGIALSGWRNHTTSTAAVTAVAPSDAGSMRQAKMLPGTCCPDSTSRLVRFAPGRNREPALTMNTLPYRNGRSSRPRSRAACRSNTTAVSRLSTAVVAATSRSSIENSTSPPPGRFDAREPNARKRPSASARIPTSRRPATRTKGGQTCEAEAAAARGAARTAATDAAAPTASNT